MGWLRDEMDSVADDVRAFIDWTWRARTWFGKQWRAKLWLRWSLRVLPLLMAGTVIGVVQDNPALGAPCFLFLILLLMGILAASVS